MKTTLQCESVVEVLLFLAHFSFLVFILTLFPSLTKMRTSSTVNESNDPVVGTFASCITGNVTNVEHNKPEPPDIS